MLEKYGSYLSQWWNGLTLWQRSWPIAFVATFWLSFWLLGGLSQEHLSTGAILLALCYGGPFTRRVGYFLLPLMLTGIAYESQQFYVDVLRGYIHVAEPYEIEKYFFGVEMSDGKVLLPSEWWQANTHPVLDVITGFFYIGYVPLFLLVAAYFTFWFPLWCADRDKAARVRELSPAIMWSFFWVNIVGYATYYIYPAAPPWYVTEHGFGPAILDTLPNPAGCVRFDEIMGTNIFGEFYGKSKNVFGAIPSLHVAYPMIAVFFAFKFGALRLFSSIFFLMMCFAAVYLNHHYIIDLVVGGVYALVGAWAVSRYYSRSIVFEENERPANKTGSTPIPA